MHFLRADGHIALFLIEIPIFSNIKVILREQMLQSAVSQIYPIKSGVPQEIVLIIHYIYT